MKIKKKTLYITSPNLVVYRHRGAERARGTELVAGGQFFSAWFSFFIGTTVLWASLLALSFSWPNLYSRYKVWLCPSGSPSWSSRLLVEKDFIHRVELGEVSGHRVLLKRQHARLPRTSSTAGVCSNSHPLSR